MITEQNVAAMVNQVDVGTKERIAQLESDLEAAGRTHVAMAEHSANLRLGLAEACDALSSKGPGLEGLRLIEKLRALAKSGVP